MGNKRIGIYRSKFSSHNKKRKRNLHGGSAKIDPSHVREDGKETSYGVEIDFPMLCSKCHIKMPSNPPTDDDWHQVQMPLSTVASELDEKGLDSLYLGMKLKFAEANRGNNWNIGHGQGKSKRA